jgi:hypothetical protein
MDEMWSRINDGAAFDLGNYFRAPTSSLVETSATSFAFYLYGPGISHSILLLCRFNRLLTLISCVKMQAL